jgi:Lar family restriction alleviation protein
VSALLPCPFCGSPARVDEGTRGYPCVLCGTCGASSDYASTDDEAEAIAAWNRRTPPAGAGEAVLPAAAEPITERAVGLPTVAVGDWIIPTGAGSCRVVDARMAYGWNQCREEVRERLAKSAAPTPLPEAVRELPGRWRKRENLPIPHYTNGRTINETCADELDAALRAIPAQAQRKENE